MVAASDLLYRNSKKNTLHCSIMFLISTLSTAAFSWILLTLSLAGLCGKNGPKP